MQLKDFRLWYQVILRHQLAPAKSQILYDVLCIFLKLPLLFDAKLQVIPKDDRCFRSD